MTEVTTIRTAAETRLGEQYKAMRADLPAGAEAARRDAAIARFNARGLPHRRIEAWHYTDLRSLLREPFAPAGQPVEAASSAIEAWLAAHPESGNRRIVLADGHLIAALSSLGDLPPGVTIASVGPSSETIAAAERLGESDAMLALNTAFAPGGAAVILAAGASMPEPVEVLNFVTGGATSAVTTRMVIDCGDHASVTLIERHVALSGADCQTNTALVVAIGDGASVDHIAIVEGLSAGSIHVGSCLSRLGADAHLTSFTLAATSGLVRRQSFVEFAGEHSAISLNGVSLLDGRNHADTTLVVTHTAAHCESREYYKTILDGESTGVYQGKVIVSPGAQKTDGKMMSRAIFLADGASMYNKPELEIFADDVVCGHGATVGFLDETQLFYLRSRGIPMKQAQSMLLNAFAADAIETVVHEGLREQLTGSVEQWLAKRQS